MKIPAKRLTPEETHALILRAQGGDVAARNTVIEANMGLVVLLATRYAKRYGKTALLDDMIQAGVVGYGRETTEGGLMRAIAKFDPAAGVRFSTYASPWIRAAISATLTDAGSMVMKGHARQRRLAAAKKREAMRAELGRDPSDEELEDAVRAAGQRVVRTVIHASGLSHVEMSWDQLGEAMTETGYDNHRSTNNALAVRAHTDMGAPSEDALIEEMDLDLRCAAVASRARASLTEREILVLQMRFGFQTGVEATLQEAGDALGISRERARQIEKSALAKLRAAGPEPRAA